MKLRDLFNTPTGFETDRWGYLRNQVLHSAVVGALPVAAFGPWAVPAVLALYALWEGLQGLLRGAEAWDGLEDFAFVAAGAIAPIAPVVLIPAAAFLASGFARRS